MDKLKSQIKGLRRRNIHQRQFVPERSLFRLLTKDAIYGALHDAGIKAHQRHEASTQIHRRGKKIFAILLLLSQPLDVMKFIEAEELHDTRIPFKLKLLQQEIGLASAEDFEEKQWEFSAPIFRTGTLNRSFNDRVVLPLAHRRELGRGGFGAVYAVTLDSDHQKKWGVFNEELAQKELESLQDHQVELENLAILNHLRHPNIVQLLSSYTYQGKHHLLFPLARDGTLADLLRTERAATKLESDEALLIALAGLSSAIEHVHDFFQQRFDLRLIGCHHDIRPRNILVSGNTFVLADFGISRFKPLSQDSATPAPAGMDDYLAPEREDLGVDIGSLVVGRSSDIWSFGCILAEIATYMATGANAVKDFRSKRLFTVRCFNIHAFHHGPHKDSAAVVEWLSMIEEQSSQSCRILVKLARTILVLDPSARPKAKQVTSVLRLIALTEASIAIVKQFEIFMVKTVSLDAVIEHKRFMAWRHAVGIIEPGAGSASVEDVQHIDGTKFNSTVACLRQMRRRLDERLSQDDASYNLGFSDLSRLNDQLGDLLNAQQQERSRAFFRISVIEDDNSRIAALIEDSNQSLCLDREIRLRASLKHMTVLAASDTERGTTQRQVPSSKIRLLRGFGEHHIGQVIEETATRDVLIEWRKYGNQGADEAVSRQLFERLNAIVEQTSLEKPETMRALDCSGYFHDESLHAFGILYDYPLSTNSRPECEPVHLGRLIVETQHSIKTHPALDDKFKLAYMLARSVFEFHSVGWLHKNLTAQNVVFFPINRALQDGWITRPYIVGFNYSRPNDSSAFTQGIDSAMAPGYQHPAYRDCTLGYRAVYDYYSLGVILLEIGLWRPLGEIADVSEEVYNDKHDKLLKERMPLLMQYMGRSYHDAVTACIETQFDWMPRYNGEVRDQSLLIEFDEKVLRRLTE